MRFIRGWQAWEDDVRNILGLSATVASGSQFHDKGDAVDRRHPSMSDFLLQVEAKYTEKGSFSVNLKKVVEWTKQAALSGRHFALAIRLWPQGQTQPADYVMVPMTDYSALVDFRRTQEEWESADVQKLVREYHHRRVRADD